MASGFDIVLELPKQARPYFLGAILALMATAFVWHTFHSALDPLVDKLDKVAEKVDASLQSLDHRLTIVETKQSVDHNATVSVP